MTKTNDQRLELSGKSLKIVKEGRDFYNDKFRFARAGCTYVIDSFRKMVEKTSDEIAQLVSRDERRQMVDAVELLPGQEFLANGEALLESLVNKKGLLESAKKLSVFQRAVIEMEGFSRTGRKPVFKRNASIQVTMDVSEQNSAFLTEFFPGKTTYVGMLIITDLFPGWYEKTISGINENLKEKARNVFGGYALPNTVALGEVLSLVAAARLPKRYQTYIDELTYFEKCCLECYCFDSTSDKKVISSKIADSKIAEFYDSFEGKQPGYISSLILDIFPLVYDKTILDLLSIFTEKERSYMAESLKPYAVDNGPAMGGLLIPAIDEYYSLYPENKGKISLKEIKDKINSLNMLELICLEMFLILGERKREE